MCVYQLSAIVLIVSLGCRYPIYLRHLFVQKIQMFQSYNLLVRDKDVLYTVSWPIVVVPELAYEKEKTFLILK